MFYKHYNDTSYSDVYPPRAVEFFKDYHSEKRIEERSVAGEILVMAEHDSILATGSLVGNEISGVFVYPVCQRQGYGKAIMSELERRAKAKGLSEISLSVSLPSMFIKRALSELGKERRKAFSLFILTP